MQGLYSFILTVFTLISVVISGCDHAPVTNNLPTGRGMQPGIQNVRVDTALYQRVYYVSISDGSDDTGSGHRAAPWKSLDFALSNIPVKGAKNEVVLLVAQGSYSESTLELKAGIDLYGGFQPKTWVRDIGKYPSVLDGNGERRLVVAADRCRLDGFQLTGGQIRGMGAAIVCPGTSPVISNNIFVGNKTLGPVPWNPKYWHETANDGGAIYCTDASAALIRNNYFYRNKTENGRGAAIACDSGSRPEIYDNVFVENYSGTDDPMRSSDGGAVSVFNWSQAKISGNIFLGNTAGASNDGGGIFLALWSSAEISKNIFVNNEAADDAGAMFVGGQEHRYDAPLDPIPAKAEFFVSISDNIFIGNRNSSMNSGAMRFTMESRGEFKRNIVAQNNGIYFQRSEVIVENNMILDNFLFIETKAGLEPGEIRNNLIWADFTLDAPAKVRRNNLKPQFCDSMNYSKIPEFENDQIQLPVFSVCYFPKKGYSEIYTGGKTLVPDQLVNRIVKAGTAWGVVKSNDEASLVVWGKFTGSTEIDILPTYSPKM